MFILLTVSKLILKFVLMIDTWSIESVKISLRMC